MKTSYFAKSWRQPYGVSIAGACPPFFEGRQFKKLAPKYWFFQQYKKDGDEQSYIECYQKEVLDALDAQQVYDDLGSNAILLCWEGKGKFCHRHLVADWFYKELGITVEEL